MVRTPCQPHPSSKGGAGYRITIWYTHSLHRNLSEPRNIKSEQSADGCQQWEKAHTVRPLNVLNLIMCTQFQSNRLSISLRDPRVVQRSTSPNITVVEAAHIAKHIVWIILKNTRLAVKCWRGECANASKIKMGGLLWRWRNLVILQKDLFHPTNPLYRYEERKREVNYRYGSTQYR